jgi:CRP-like cAMP-binding protein
VDARTLESIPLFAVLKSNERAAVARRADEVDVPEGKHLVDEGRFGYEFFVIREGTADVRRGDQVIASLGPGDFFGELALLQEDHRRTASVVATSPLRVIVMTSHDFAAMDRELPRVAERIRAACYPDR